MPPLMRPQTATMSSMQISKKSTTPRAPENRDHSRKRKPRRSDPAGFFMSWLEAPVTRAKTSVTLCQRFSQARNIQGEPIRD